MSFDIRIEGLDEAIKEIEKLEKGISFEYLTFWCNRISNDVRLRGSKKLIESFTFNVKLSEDNNPQFELNYAKELRELLIDTIKEYLHEMPTTTQMLFEQLIDMIEGKLTSG